MKKIEIGDFQTNYFITDNLYIAVFKNLPKRIKFIHWLSYCMFGIQIGSRAIELNYYRK